MRDKPDIAILDYGLGNIFSVMHACEYAGMSPRLVSDAAGLLSSDAAILPGVGAFGDAMGALVKLDLDGPIKDFAASGKPLVGICLGQQLLMSESHEFGRHKGLGLIEGEVIRFEPAAGYKVPQVGWNRIAKISAASWDESPLRGIKDGEFMYFVHSFYVKPSECSVVLSKSEYGGIEFCSALGKKNVWAFQFHPERSGPDGLRIYENISVLINNTERKG